jgi:drug/metabolite transporter (DMT)-like permease
MVLIWGINFIVLKASLAVMNPLAFNAMRFGLAAALLSVIARLRGAPAPPREMIPRLIAMGFIGNSVYQMGFIEGVARTRAGNAALLMAAVPLQTAVLSHLRGHERLRGRDLAGLALSSAGIAALVLSSGRGVAFGSTVKGDLLVLAATICWSVYTLGTKPLADRLGATTVTAWTMGFGAIPLILVSLPSLATQDWSRVTPAAVGGMLYSALGALVLAYLIWARGVRRIGPARTAIYSNFTPVVAMLAAWALLGETPTPWQIVGAGGIFAGLYLART